eukprot:6349503-Karenia_brevis.AAC.1
MQVTGLTLHVINFNAATSACEENEQWDRAQEAGLRPDVISFHAAISACDHAGQWRMRSGSTICNVIGFNAAISACTKGGQWEKVQLEDIITDGEYPPSPEQTDGEASNPGP